MYRSTKPGATRFNIVDIQLNELKIQKDKLLSVLAVFLASNKNAAAKTAATDALSEITQAVYTIALNVTSG